MEAVVLIKDEAQVEPRKEDNGDGISNKRRINVYYRGDSDREIQCCRDCDRGAVCDRSARHSTQLLRLQAQEAKEDLPGTYQVVNSSQL